MKILILARPGESLTGGGTYQANVVKELAKRHEVKVYESPADLDQDWDVAHCVNLKHLSLSVARKLRCPLVVDAHDYYWVNYYHFLCLDFPFRFVLQKLRKIKYHFLFKYIDGIILHGRYLYDLFDHPNKYLNFYFGLDYSGVVQKPWTEKENLILFVGGDYFRKGLPRLLKALPLVLQKIPSARVMVIGKDYWYAKLFARLLGRGLPVTYANGMPRDEVYRMYGKGKVLVLPSEIEATPLVIAEAAAAGIPVVVSEVGGHPELVHNGRTGFLFSLEHPADFAEKMACCLTDAESSGRLVKGAKEFMVQFTMDRMMGEIEATYRDVIAKGKRKR
jgi:glycosyltransferase involved in cell wall biosynthesis